MARKEFKFEVVDVLEVLEESGNSNWAKILSKASVNDDVPKIDIRNVNLQNLQGDGEGVIYGKGITLSDEGAKRLALALIDNGYVTREELIDYLEGTENLFKRSDVEERLEKVKVINIKKVK